jgi:hypothetical protein
MQVQCIPYRTHFPFNMWVLVQFFPFNMHSALSSFFPFNTPSLKENSNKKGERTCNYRAMVMGFFSQRATVTRTSFFTLSMRQRRVDFHSQQATGWFTLSYGNGAIQSQHAKKLYRFSQLAKMRRKGRKKVSKWYYRSKLRLRWLNFRIVNTYDPIRYAYRSFVSVWFMRFTTLLIHMYNMYRSCSDSYWIVRYVSRIVQY